MTIFSRVSTKKANLPILRSEKEISSRKILGRLKVKAKEEARKLTKIWKCKKLFLDDFCDSRD